MKPGEYWNIELDFYEFTAAKVLLAGKDDDEVIQIEFVDADGVVRKPYLNTNYIIQAEPSSPILVRNVWGDQEQPATVRKIKD
jgi:hypothetical protein